MPDPADLLSHYRAVRSTTERLAAPLTPEDCVIQSMPDCSPARWHLAHTAWFFETFLLAETPGYRPFHPAYGYLFNSYYNAIGDRTPRSMRGTMSRPGVDEIRKYRAHVDARMCELLASSPSPEQRGRTLLGLHHEQQHQELLLTDIKHAFSLNPLRPAYREGRPPTAQTPSPLVWIDHPGGLAEIGHAGGEFGFDNESPRHKTYLAPFRIANRLTTCGEFGEFVEAGGYRRPEFWLSEGWATVSRHNWSGPLYWEKDAGAWIHFTLDGVRPVAADEPVTHLSYFEADAYARFRGARLPTESEWESVAAAKPAAGSFLEGDNLHPVSADGGFFGEAHQWTASPYVGYPGFRTAPGAIGEYNGKFMCNQFVLRGLSCVTPRSHFRVTYRNFFPADARWQFTGLRLAQDS